MNYGKPNKEKFNDATKLIKKNTGSKEEKTNIMTTVLAVKFSNERNYTDTYIMTEEEYKKFLKRMNEWNSKTKYCDCGEFMAWDPIIVAKNITRKELTKFVLKSDLDVAWDIIQSEEYGFTYDCESYEHKIAQELESDLTTEIDAEYEKNNGAELY